MSDALNRVGPTVVGIDPDQFISRPEFRSLLRVASVAAVTRRAANINELPDAAGASELSKSQETAVEVLRRMTGTLWPNSDSTSRRSLLELLERIAIDIRVAMGSQELLPDDAVWHPESPIAALSAVCYEHSSHHQKAAAPHVTPGSDYCDRVQAFRDAVSDETGWLTPPHIDTIRRKPIADLYVASNVVFHERTDEPPRSYSFEQLSQCLFRTVVLGNPGGGKTTLAQRIAHLLAQPSTGLVTPHVPLFVRLRSYQGDTPLIDFLLQELGASYGDLITSTDLQFTLEVGAGVVLLDGLDELLDTGERRRLVSAVNDFAAEYPVAPILVTSREVGYYEAPLDGRGFSSWLLAPFNEMQAREYVGKWFSADSTVPSKRQQTMADGLIRECREVPDLRSSPLLLALLCQIYRGEGYIPRNRPAVYEKCAVMLFERWDRSRGLFAPTTIEAHLRPAMEHLAYWIFSTPGLANGVTEAQLLDEATDYLRTWRYESAPDARAAAVEFVEFCRGRAWVFTDTGTTGDGEPVYQFSHRTFLEYFSALHLVRTKRSEDELLGTLIPHVARQEWDTVATMAFQIAAEYTQGAGDELLQRTLQEAHSRESESERSALLAFAGRCLGVLVPRPVTTRSVCANGASDALRHLSKQNRQARGRDGQRRDAPFQTLDALLHVAAENWSPTEQTLLEVAASYMQGDQQSSLMCADIFANLAATTRSLASESTVARWQQTSERFISQHIERLEALSVDDLSVALDLVTSGHQSHATLFDRFGVSSYFVSRRLPGSSGGRISLADLAFHWLLTGRGFNVPSERVIDGLCSSGKRLSSMMPPWVRTTTRWASPPVETPGASRPKFDDLPEPARWMSVVLVCSHVEDPFEDFAEGGPLPPSSDDRAWEAMRVLISTRVGRQEVALAPDAATTITADPTLANLLTRWSRNEVEFVGDPAQLELDRA